MPEIEWCQAVKEEETSAIPLVKCMMGFAEYCQSNSTNSDLGVYV